MTDLHKVKPKIPDIPGQQFLNGAETRKKFKKKPRTEAVPGPVRQMRRVIKWVPSGGQLREQLCGFVYVDDGRPCPRTSGRRDRRQHEADDRRVLGSD